MSPSYIIQFIIMNMKSKSNLSVLDIAAGSGGFVFDLLEIKELSFVFLVAVDNGLYEKVYDEDFEEEFNENVLKYKSETNNSSKVILQYFKQDEYRFLEKTYNKYDIINISNFLHFFDWDTICKYIKLSLSKLQPDGRIFINVARTGHSSKRIKYFFDENDIENLKKIFNIIQWKQEANHFIICISNNSVNIV